MTLNKKAIGGRIKDIRLNSPIVRKRANSEKPTLEDFARLVNSNKSNVSRWEKGHNVPNDITLSNIAELGDITVEELLYGQKDLEQNVEEFLLEKFDEYITVEKEVIKSEIKLLLGSVIDMPLQLLGIRDGTATVEDYEHHQHFMKNMENYGRNYIHEHYKGYSYEKFNKSLTDSSLHEFQKFKETEWDKTKKIFDEIIETYKISFNENNKVWITRRFTEKINDDLTEIRIRAIEEEKEDYYINELVQPILDEAAKKIKEINNNK